MAVRKKNKADHIYFISGILSPCKKGHMHESVSQWIVVFLYFYTEKRFLVVELNGIFWKVCHVISTNFGMIKY